MSRTKKYDWPDVVYHSPEWWRRWRLVNNENYRRYKRDYDSNLYKLYPEREIARRIRYQNKYPYKIRAHQIVASAVRSGRLIKEPCKNCGGKDVVAHHDNYGKPLDVIWLCEIHHKAHHRYLLSVNHNSEPTKQEAKLLLTKHYRWR